jgi:GNAT superfamily N-acetyltransferase/predicted nucleic acid-binding protein
MISTLRSSLAVAPDHSIESVTILLRPVDVSPFVKTVIAHADLDREALGFLPEQAYEAAASSGHLFVAVKHEQETPTYLGHLFFGGAFPHLRVYQAYVLTQARRLGIAKCLLKELIAFAEHHGYMDITAKVASDLETNTFWERMGFETARTQPGGSARNRTINVRMKQLNTPTLFGYPDGEPVTALPSVRRNNSGYVPVYGIDLNVFFDLVKRRSRAEHAGRVISAALDNFIRIVVTQEFVVELTRSFKPNTPDPILEFALQLPTIPPPESSKLSALTMELAHIIFPDRAKQGRLSVQDNSDLIHLATAIYHSASGFVTAENALVNSAEVIESRYGIKVVHVQHLAQLLEKTKRRAITVETRFGGNELRVSEMTDPLRKHLGTIIEKIQLSDDIRVHVAASDVRSSHNRSLAVSFDDSLVCAALWDCSAMLRNHFVVTVIADEDHPAIDSALDALLLAVAHEAVVEGPSLIELVIPKAHVLTREMALCNGFMQQGPGTSDTGHYQRMAIGHVVSERMWTALRSEIASQTGNLFPETLPSLDAANAKISFTNREGKLHQISGEDLETSLAPVLLCSSTRIATLVPIRRTFADHLLNTAAQGSLLPGSAAALFHERVYYSSSRNANVFTPGSILIFYESGRHNGRSAAIAVARVRETATVSKQEVASALLRHGVLSIEEIETLSNKTCIAATVFDNLICLQDPVSLRVLRTLGCIDGANLVGARRVTSNQLSEILKQGGQVGF